MLVVQIVIQIVNFKHRRLLYLKMLDTSETRTHVEGLFLMTLPLFFFLLVQLIFLELVLLILPIVFPTLLTVSSFADRCRDPGQCALTFM